MKNMCFFILFFELELLYIVDLSLIMKCFLRCFVLLHFFLSVIMFCVLNVGERIEVRLSKIWIILVKN